MGLCRCSAVSLSSRVENCMVTKCNFSVDREDGIGELWPYLSKCD